MFKYVHIFVLFFKYIGCVSVFAELWGLFVFAFGDIVCGCFGLLRCVNVSDRELNFASSSFSDSRMSSVIGFAGKE